MLTVAVAGTVRAHEFRTRARFRRSRADPAIIILTLTAGISRPLRPPQAADPHTRARGQRVIRSRLVSYAHGPISLIYALLVLTHRARGVAPARDSRAALLRSCSAMARRGGPACSSSRPCSVLPAQARDCDGGKRDTRVRHAALTLASFALLLVPSSRARTSPHTRA